MYIFYYKLPHFDCLTTSSQEIAFCIVYVMCDLMRGGPCRHCKQNGFDNFAIISRSPRRPRRPRGPRRPRRPRRPQFLLRN